MEIQTHLQSFKSKEIQRRTFGSQQKPGTGSENMPEVVPEKGGDKMNKPTKKELAEELQLWICETICKHAGKKESVLLKECKKCQLEEKLTELRRR